MRDALGDLFGYQKKEKSRAFVAIGTLSGLLLGVAAGLLVAPQSGKETRDDIKKAAEKGYGKVVDTSQKVSDYVRDKGQEVVQKFHKEKDKVVEEVQEEIAEVAEEIADEAQA